MKQKLWLCSMLFVLSVCATTSAKNSPYRNLREVAGWSNAPVSRSLNSLPYKNILDTAKWSRLPTGRALRARLKRNAHSPLPAASDEIFLEDSSGAGCGWTCCFKSCVSSAMKGTGELCIANCTVCGLEGSPWACAVCVGCGAVGFAAIEFCGLHCCVNPGC